MEIKTTRQISYRQANKILSTQYSDIAYDREAKLKLYEKLLLQGCSKQLALEAIQISRATYYRYKHKYKSLGLVGLNNKSKSPHKKRQTHWTKHQQQLVLNLRNTYPLWGKAKICTILHREYDVILSESTVGRILTKLVKLNKVKPVSFYLGKTRAKKRRRFNGHSKRWRLGMKAKRPGELLQIDHMSVEIIPGKIVKEFKATCPITGYTVMNVYSNASSDTARLFLKKVKSDMPFTVKTIQVDGGSEFRDKFEIQCQKQDIGLYVLPPRSPKYNGCVERANCTSRYEFYPFYTGGLSLEQIRPVLNEYQQFYNYFRPHQSNNQLTPMAYYKQLYL